MDQGKSFDGSKCLCSGTGFCEHLNMQTNEGLWGFCQSAGTEERQAMSALIPKRAPSKYETMSFPFITVADLNGASREILQKLGDTKISAVAGIPRIWKVPVLV